jgi:hypothetical protein
MITFFTEMFICPNNRQAVIWLTQKFFDFVSYGFIYQLQVLAVFTDPIEPSEEAIKHSSQNRKQDIVPGNGHKNMLKCPKWGGSSYILWWNVKSSDSKTVNDMDILTQLEKWTLKHIVILHAASENGYVKMWLRLIKDRSRSGLGNALKLLGN